MGMFYVKIHKVDGKNILAICDADLLGKVFVSDGLKLNIQERFYNGGKKTKEQTKGDLLNFTNANLVGRETVDLAIEIGVVSKEYVKQIANVPYTMLFEI